MSLKWIINLTFLMRFGMIIFLFYVDFVLIDLIRSHIKKGKDILTISVTVLFTVLFSYIFNYDLGPNSKNIPLWMPILLTGLIIVSFFYISSRKNILQKMKVICHDSEWDHNSCHTFIYLLVFFSMDHQEVKEKQTFFDSWLYPCFHYF